MSDFETVESTFETRFVPDAVPDQTNPQATPPEQGAGHYLFGAVIDGVFVVFASRKAGGINADLARAKAEKAKSSSRKG